MKYFIVSIHSMYILTSLLLEYNRIDSNHEILMGCKRPHLRTYLSIVFVCLHKTLEERVRLEYQCQAIT
jgi:hypothetical protein